MKKENKNNYQLLNTINNPSDLKKIPIDQLELLAVEIRNYLLEVVAEQGGHLAPNLGVVELSIALHYVFNSPEDLMVWDVGHQSYIHKLLTGRRDFLKSLRDYKGCRGFLSREESEYDVFGAGHAGTAISAGIGLAVARDIKKEQHKVISIVGDGSLNCGISLEGLNNISEATKDLIVILNDNKMSISQNVGAIPSLLSRIITGESYNQLKSATKAVLNKLPKWHGVHKGISKLEEATKSLLVPGVFFEELGLRYVGPINGHDLPEMIRTLEGVKKFKAPVVLHTITEKGRGYEPARLEPERFHGLAQFDISSGKSLKKQNKATFSSAFGDAMLRLAEKYPKSVAITAAMTSGTGLSEFREKHPERLYDVGIAEEHATVFAAGLAAGGIRPVVAMYSTFLQRALDCIIHDVCLQKLPVIFCCDRSGIVEDGPTHHGIHDVAFLRNIPNLSIIMPKDENELHHALFSAYHRKEATVIRYAKGASNHEYNKKCEIKELPWGKIDVVKSFSTANVNKVSFWALGVEVSNCEIISDILQKKYGIDCEIISVRFIKPFDKNALLTRINNFDKNSLIVTLEDHQMQGGLASIVDEIITTNNEQFAGKVLHFGWGNEFIGHGDTDLLRQEHGLDNKSIYEKIVAAFGC